MKSIAKIPDAITDYIKQRFRDNFLFELKTHRLNRYVVEVAKDEYIYTLTFSEHGSLLREEDEPAFPEDEHEGAAAIM